MSNKKNTWEGHVYKLASDGRFHAVVSYNDVYGFEYPIGARGAGYDDLKDAAVAAKAYADLLQEIGQDDRSEGNMVAKDRLPQGEFVTKPSPKAALKTAAIRGSGKKKPAAKTSRKGPKGP